MWGEALGGVIVESADGDFLAQLEKHPIPGCLRVVSSFCWKWLLCSAGKDNLAMGASSLQHLPFLPHGVASALGCSLEGAQVHGKHLPLRIYGFILP